MGRYMEVPTELVGAMEVATNDLEVARKAIDKHFENSVTDMASNLEYLDEQVLVYKGLMANTRINFKAAATEQLELSYKLWEDIEEQAPVVSKKVKAVVAELRPISDELNKMNSLLNKIDLRRMNDLMEMVGYLNTAPEGTINMISFLMEQYKEKENK